MDLIILASQAVETYNAQRRGRVITLANSALGVAIVTTKLGNKWQEKRPRVDVPYFVYLDPNGIWSVYDPDWEDDPDRKDDGKDGTKWLSQVNSRFGEAKIGKKAAVLSANSGHFREVGVVRGLASDGKLIVAFGSGRDSSYSDYQVFLFEEHEFPTLGVLR